MVGTEYRPYLSWTDCNLKVEVDPGYDLERGDSPSLFSHIFASDE